MRKLSLKFGSMLLMLEFLYLDTNQQHKATFGDIQDYVEEHGMELTEPSIRRYAKLFQEMGWPVVYEQGTGRRGNFSKFYWEV